ncbi:hypothetical protein [Sphingobacterium cellulitidis]|uniref:hypothetical protein n=1 Tax=Sphingobacterium cellulitidis TaxID=1768011 RepID=UPI000B94078E|nr:hypothetical protein CHT99_02905 [Sphingobacterium cellulitidis]
MSSLRIPEHLRQGFENLVTMDSLLFDKIIDYIKSFKEFNNLESARDSTKRFILEIGIDESVNDVIYSLSSLKARYPTKNMAEDLLESFKSFAGSDPVDEKLFKTRINTLSFNSSTLNTYLKKNVLGSSFEKTLVYSEVITDIRFIFNSDILDKSRSAIITHNLKLEIIDSMENKDIYISMDIDSLKELNATIERAIQKEEIIKSDYSPMINFS